MVFITGYTMPLVIRVVPNSAFCHSAKHKQLIPIYGQRQTSEYFNWHTKCLCDIHVQYTLFYSCLEYYISFTVCVKQFETAK